MTQATLTGSCLCGAVKYEATGVATRFLHCHCSRCRKATGTGHASNLFLQPGTRREDPLRRRDQAATGRGCESTASTLRAAAVPMFT